jgi:type IX secretion system PorP/SprF family membrane protein
MVNPYTLNPALAGSEDFVDIKMGYRTQWVGFNDSDGYIDGAIAPRTMYVSAHTALGHDHGYYRDPRHEHKAFHGVGGFVTSDKLGAFESNSLYGSYSYNMLLFKSNRSGQMYGFNGKDRHIGVRMVVGAHLGMYQHKVNTDWLAPYHLVDQNAPVDAKLALSVGNLNKWGPDGSLGTWIYSNNYYLGAAVRRILANPISQEGDKLPDFNLSRHYNLMGGYKFMMSDMVLFEPSVNMKFEAGAVPSVDFNALLVYDNTYTNSRGSANHKNTDLHCYTGVTYRPGAAMAFMIGGVVERKYEITYSFDLTTNRLNPYESGTHEVTLGLRLPPKFTFYTAEDKTHHSGVKHH